MWELYKDNGKENGNEFIRVGNEGIYWSSIGIMEEKMETTTIIKAYIGGILGL